MRSLPALCGDRKSSRREGAGGNAPDCRLRALNSLRAGAPIPEILSHPLDDPNALTLNWKYRAKSLPASDIGQSISDELVVVHSPSSTLAILSSLSSDFLASASSGLTSANRAAGIDLTYLSTVTAMVLCGSRASRTLPRGNTV